MGVSHSRGCFGSLLTPRKLLLISCTVHRLTETWDSRNITPWKDLSGKPRAFNSPIHSAFGTRKPHQLGHHYLVSGKSMLRCRHQSRPWYALNDDAGPIPSTNNRASQVDTAGEPQPRAIRLRWLADSLFPHYAINARSRGFGASMRKVADHGHASLAQRFFSFFSSVPTRWAYCAINNCRHLLAAFVVYGAWHVSAPRTSYTVFGPFSRPKQPLFVANHVLRTQ